jgi:TonB family protein
MSDTQSMFPPRHEADESAANVPTLLDGANTLPPTPLRDLLAAEGASIVVLSADAELIRAVGEASGEQYPVFAVGTWPELTEEVRTGYCGIALLDIHSIEGDLDSRIDELKAMAPKLIVLAASERDEAEDLIALLSERKIHRLLIKPAAVGMTRLLLESAVARHLEHREEPPAAAKRLGQGGPSLPSDAPSRRRWPVWAVVTVLATVALGAAVVAGLSRVGSPPPVVQAPREREPAPPADARAARQPSAPPRADPAVADLLARAATALDQQRLSDPPGDNALELYRAALRADPDNAEAAARLDTVLDALFSRAEQALLDGNQEKASTALERIRAVRPGSSRLAFLDAELERSPGEAATAAEPAPRAAPDADVTPELDSLLTMARARLQQGQLLTPAGDSAEAYLQRTEGLGSDDARVTALRADLAAAVSAAASALLDSGDTDRAEPLIGAARRLGAGEQTAARLEARLAEARQAEARQREAANRQRQQGLLSSGLARLRNAALIAPERDSALSYLRALRAEAPDFPGLEAAWNRLLGAIADNVQQALDAGQWDAAQRWLDALKRAPGDSATVASLTHQLTVGRTQAGFLRSAAAAGELQLLEAPPAEYPAGAVRAGTEGWVDLEFIVGRDGRPRDLTVVGAEPQGRFDQAALQAVSGYRYAPFEQDGEVYERRVRLRVRFALQ